MSLRCYQCTKCRITVTKDSFPSASGCINETTHHWHELGEVGNSNFSCNKCGTSVQTKSFPDSAGCLNGTTHSWHKL